MKVNIRAHARRLGLGPGLLIAALLQHSAQELAEWTDAREAADPGSVWHSGDVPEWLARYLPKREGF